MALLFLGIVALQASAAEEEKDTPAAAKTRGLLKKKVTLDFKTPERLKDIIEEIQEQVKGIQFRVDTTGGVSMNKKMSIQCKDMTLEKALETMLGKEDLGYIVISKKGNAYDGSVLIRMGKERGFPVKKE
jgi:hypothetical protein